MLFDRLPRARPFDVPGRPEVPVEAPVRLRRELPRGVEEHRLDGPVPQVELRRGLARGIDVEGLAGPAARIDAGPADQTAGVRAGAKCGTIDEAGRNGS